jgi:RNA polymerase sigma-70 factor, ECF subfamily
VVSMVGTVSANSTPASVGTGVGTVGRRYAPGRLPADARMRELYQAHAHALHRFLLGVTFGEQQAAEDLVQETLLRAWRNLDQLAPDVASLRPWLFTVARRIAIDAARARQARPSEVGAVDMTVMPERDDPIERLIAVQTVRAALRRLTEEHRRVLIEIYYRGRSVAEAASLLGIPEGTVKSRTYNALRALRSILDEEDAGS